LQFCCLTFASDVVAHVRVGYLCASFSLLFIPFSFSTVLW